MSASEVVIDRTIAEIGAVVGNLTLIQITDLRLILDRLFVEHWINEYHD